MGTKPKAAKTFESLTDKDSCFIQVPLCFQETVYTCGVACVQSILACHGIIYRQDILAKLLKQKPIYGTDYHNIINFLETLGFQVTFDINMSIDGLKTEIKNGKTPILMIQAWKEDEIDYTFTWRESHYAIACGYDEESIIFMDPYTLGFYTYIPNTELIKRWHSIDQSGNQYYFTGLIIHNENCPFVYNPDIIIHQG